MAMLCRYAWPGNVREMRAVIERALIMQSGDRLFFEPQPDVVAAQENASGKSLNDGMRDQILATLRETKGRINGPGGAANLLDVNPSTLRSRMKKLSIPFGRHCKAVY
jgi:transcriptional regulator of acetoin/glycerol metabolism